MREPVRSTKKPAVHGAAHPPSPWAVALLVASSGFAAAAVALLTSGYAPA